MPPSGHSLGRVSAHLSLSLSLSLSLAITEPAPSRPFPFSPPPRQVSDVSQQAHVLEAAPMFKGAQRSGAQHGKGILAPLLFTDPDDLPPPPAAALLGVAFRKAFGRQGTFVGTVVAHDSALGYHLEYLDGDEEDVGLDELVRLPLASPDALVGRRVSKHFAGYGRFEGRVAAYEGTRASSPSRPRRRACMC